MSGEAKSWLNRIGPVAHSQLATQAAVLLPVLALAGLSWTLGAKGQSVHSPAAVVAAIQAAVPPNATPTAVETIPPAPAEATPPVQAVPVEAPLLNGLRISSQSWRRGGLGSNALVTFTLRNDNEYAVKDIEIACAFTRPDGSHLTERKRIISDIVNMKSRKTFARMHIGFVNVNADKAKCTLVAASRI